MSVEIEVKKSRFIAYLTPVEELEERLAQLKKKHKKARHFVWAYRYLEDGVLREKANDDGEPSGTAGRPVLNVLQKRGVLGYAVIVVRYFGGIKLGAGGLVKAYTKAASSLLDEVL
jgi:uncharacterized YigZ family protein